MSIPIYYDMPRRASDAGPESSEEEPKDWRDYLSDADDEISLARRLSEDDLAIERARRLNAIDNAIEALENAKAALPVPACELLTWHRSTIEPGTIIRCERISIGAYQVRTVRVGNPHGVELCATETRARERFERIVADHYDGGPTC